ncbi:MAG: phage replication initiation protein, NGO0469 family [Candidatus Hodarchaeales archaeon]
MKAPEQVGENKSSGKGFQSPEAGKSRAWVYKIIDLGTQETEYQGEVSYKRQLMFLFELVDQLMEDGKPLVIPKTYTFSFYDKARLYMDIDSWMDGSAFEGMENPSSEFDTEVLFKVPCELTIETKGKGTYITKIGRCKSTEGLTQRVNPSLEFSLDNFDETTYNGFSDKMKAKIALSPEYQSVMKSINEAKEALNG